nr:ATP synthase F0 subunit 8 [Stenochironomus sp. 1CZ]
MPQMAPMMWMLLMSFFLFLVIFYMTIIYHNPSKLYKK